MGLNRNMVGQVAGALVGVVVGEDVAGEDIVAEGVHHALQRGGHAAEVRRQGQALGHLLALGVEQGGGKVHAVFDDAERAVRTTVSAIVSAALISAFLMISRVTGSVVCSIGFSSSPWRSSWSGLDA